MEGKNLPKILITLSLLLILANIITAEKFDKGFYLQILSSVLLIIAMVLTIRHKKNKKSE